MKKLHGKIEKNEGTVQVGGVRVSIQKKKEDVT